MPRSAFSAALLLVYLVSAFTDAEAAERAQVLDLKKAPHIRMGLWNLSVTLGGRYRQPDRFICFGDVSIVTPQHSGCAPWIGRFIPPRRYLLSDTCHVGPKTLRVAREFSGNLKDSFTVRDSYLTSVDGITKDPATDQVIHTFVADACPPNMPVKRTF